MYMVTDRFDETPGIYLDEGNGLGRQSCGCCYVFATRREAVVHALSLMRKVQKNILAELATCENIIVSYERELSNS